MPGVQTVGLSADLNNARFYPTTQKAEPNTIIEFSETGHMRVADENGDVWYRKVPPARGMAAAISPVMAKHPELKRAEKVRAS